MNFGFRVLLGCCLLLGLGSPAHAQTASHLQSPDGLKRLSLEELLTVEVTSGSRRAEPATRAAAAVEAITPEQIERTGATSVPDVLRLATGMQVSRFSAGSFAISSRGFTSLAANKLQVLQDGRSLYSPLFSGVFWDAYATLLEDVDRIEVIRGPGATMWGSNAVLGVINIVTKDARDTQGTLVTAGAGTEERLFGAVRHGGKAGERAHYRGYARYRDLDALALPNGNAASAAPVESQAGFRFDARPDDRNRFTVQADYLQNETDTAFGEEAFNRSGFLLGRWTHSFRPDTELQLQTYYDRFEREVPRQFGERRDTFDLDAQLRMRVVPRHDLVAGLNYRNSADDTMAGGTAQFDPRGKTVRIFSAFAQDEISLVPDRLSLVLGSKFEWHSLGGFEPQPGIRAAWTPTERQTLWAAVARAVRMPSRIDEDLRFLQVPASGVVLFRGNPDFQPEKLASYELGYRVRPNHALFLDFALFLNDYDGLRSLEPSPPRGLPLVQFNRLDARTSGVEFAAKYQAAPWWRISANYAYLHKRLKPQANSNDPNRGSLEGNDASHIASLWSSFDLPRRVTLDGILRYSGTLPQPVVPAYLQLDVRLAWRPTAAWEFSVVGQNLLDRQQREFGVAAPNANEVERSMHAKISWRF